MSREQGNRPLPDRDALRKRKEKEAKVTTRRLEGRLRRRPRLIVVGETMHIVNVGVSGFLFYVAMEKSLPYLGLLAGVGGVIFARRVILYERMRRNAKKERSAFENLRGGRQKRK